MKLSDYVLRFVADQGVKHVFLVTGGGAMHLNQSLGSQPAIKAICNSHEQASAICAEGYAKATNHLGVCMVTTGPGGTNAVTGVAGAWLDSTPTLFLSGQVKRPDRMFDKQGRPLGMRQLGVQEVDIVSIVKPITKYAVTVLDPNEIRYHLEKAVYLAFHGRPGPVWIDIPLDVQASPIEEPSSLRGFDPAELKEPADASLKNEVTRLIQKLNHAERPLLFAGNGIRLAHAEKEFEQLRTMLRIPTVATWCAADLVPSNDPLYVGRPGSVAARGANFALQNSDFLLAIGVRLDFAITGYAPQNLARGAHKAVVDIDQAELKKLHPHVQQPIQSDAKKFLAELLRQKDSIRLSDHSAWDARCTGLENSLSRSNGGAPQARRTSFGVSPCRGDRHRGRNQMTTWWWEVRDRPLKSICSPFLPCIPSACFIRLAWAQWAMPSPWRSQYRVANPGRDVIAVDGDGGFMFNIQELETIRRLQLPIKFFVMNNDGYSSIRASQKAYFGEANLGSDRSNGLTVPSLTQVASGIWFSHGGDQESGESSC